MITGILDLVIRPGGTCPVLARPTIQEGNEIIIIFLRGIPQLMIFTAPPPPILPHAHTTLYICFTAMMSNIYCEITDLV